MYLTLNFVAEGIEETDEYIEFTVRALSADMEIQTGKGLVVFPSEVLIKRQGDLIGKPLLLDHEWKVDKIVGVVVHSWFDDTQKAIMARVRVAKEGNEKLISLIKLQPSPVKSVSIGAVVVKEKDKVKDIEFKELSLVFEGADPNAKIIASRYEDIELSTSEWWNDPELRDKAPQDFFLDPSSRRYPYRTWDGKISCERLKAAMQLSSLHGHKQIYDRAKRLYEKHCKKEA